MKFFASKACIAVAIGSAFLLTACGGGSPAASSTTTTTASMITSSNAPDVAAHAFSASDGLAGQSNSSSTLLTGVSTDTVSSGLLDSSLLQIYRALDVRSAANLVTGVTSTASASCTNGGTIAVTASIAVAGKISNGDSLSITATNCVEGTTKLNGGLGVTFSNMAGTFGSSSIWSGTLALTFTNLSVDTGTESSTANGDLTLIYSQTGFQNSTAVVSGNSLQLTLTKSGVTVVNRTLSAFKHTSSINSTLYTYNNNYTLAGNFPKLGNVSYAVKTITDFKKQAGSYPYQGSMIITAGDKTTATLTAIDSINVKIELDKNGDGVIDETINTTWVALKNRI